MERVTFHQMCSCEKASREELNEETKRREQVERDCEEVKMEFRKLSQARFDILPHMTHLRNYSRSSTQAA